MLLSAKLWLSLLSFFLCAIAAFLLFSILKIAKSALSSPLNKIPGPILNRWTDILAIFSIIRFRKLYYVDSLHQKYGPFVRVGPNEISVSSIPAVKEIHNVRNGFRKADFYENLQLKGTLVALTDNKIHAARRRHFAGAFSSQNLREWESVILGCVKKAVRGITDRGQEGKEVDVLKAFHGMAEEVIGELCFGEAFKSEGTGPGTPFDKDTKRQAVINSIRTEIIIPGSELSRTLPFYLKHLPRPILSRILRRNFDNTVCDTLRRDDLVKSTEKKHTLLTKALAQNEEGYGLSDETIVMEAKAFIVAGTDTTANVSSYLIWAVLKHPEVKEALLNDLAKLGEDFSISDVQSLPYLHMVTTESLRLYGAVSAGLPRVSPAGGWKMGEYFVPEGTTVATQYYTTHRNPETFKDPLSFNPERWENPTPQMKEAFMPFGIGARACIGPKLAQIELALAAAIFFRECSQARVAPSTRDEDMISEDLFVVSPKGHKCMIVVAPS